MFERLLSKGDAQRVGSCLTTLQDHGIAKWALAGSVAIGLRLAERGVDAEARSLNDLDFVTASFDEIPRSLGTDFLVRHVHPLDPPDRTIAQFVSSPLVLRVDVFRAHPEVMNRATPMQTEFGVLRIVSLGDLLARTVRLILPIINNRPVPSKHASDFFRLLDVAGLDDAEAAWLQHRRAGDSKSLRDAVLLLRKIVPHRGHLLITPQYSRNATEHCSRCAKVKGLELADPAAILAILGYC